MCLEFGGEIKISLRENVLYATLEKKGFQRRLHSGPDPQGKAGRLPVSHTATPRTFSRPSPQTCCQGPSERRTLATEVGGGGLTCRAPVAHTPAGPLCAPSRSSLPSPALPLDSSQGLLLLPPAPPAPLLPQLGRDQSSACMCSVCIRGTEQARISGGHSPAVSRDRGRITPG